MSLSRRDFLKWGIRSVGAVSVASLGGVGYTTRIEPYHVGVTQVEVPLAKLPAAFDGFTLAHISDLHLEGWNHPDHIQSAMEQVAALNTDVIVMTGDYVTDDEPTAETVQAFRYLTGRGNVYATLGNHDHWVNHRAVRTALLEAGAFLVINDYVILERGSDRLYLAGVDDVWERRHRIDRALDGIPDESCVVLLAHEPDYADEVARDGRVSLQLSGHTHGGQVRLPFIGAPMLPHLGEKYNMGLYTIDALQLFVTRGIGMVRPFVRFGCPPEIAHITLRKS